VHQNVDHRTTTAPENWQEKRRPHEGAAKTKQSEAN
jgi:hypothetical protein